MILLRNITPLLGNSSPKLFRIISKVSKINENVPDRTKLRSIMVWFSESTRPVAGSWAMEK